MTQIELKNNKPLITALGLFIVGMSGLMLLVKTQKTPVALPIEQELLTKSKVLGEYSYQAEGEVQKKLGLVYGFLPYWNVGDYQIPEPVSHLAFFRLAVNGQGEIVKKNGDGGYQVYEGEKFQNILQQIKRRKIKLEMTFFSAQSGEIEELIECESCQDKLVETMATLIARDQLDGINLDFEYLGTVSPQQREKFTHFVYKVKNMIDVRHPRVKLSIDVYGGAAKMNNLWDFPKLAKIVDRVIVMGYDYKTKRATVPGPSAPTLGQTAWGGDIWADIISLIKFIPSEKIVLAVPFYGYAWETTTDNLATAKTFPDTGATLTYKGAQMILNDKNLKAKEKWDEKSLTPYLVYYDHDRHHIGFFENERSLGFKMDLIEKLNLGGIAIWALGYEGEHQQLWDEINQRF